MVDEDGHYIFVHRLPFAGLPAHPSTASNSEAESHSRRVPLPRSTDIVRPGRLVLFVPETDSPRRKYDKFEISVTWRATYVSRVTRVREQCSITKLSPFAPRRSAGIPTPMTPP